MTDIRTVADPITKEIYYPQTHYQAVIGLVDFTNKLIDSKFRELSKPKYIEDLKQINVSGLFYFDEKTQNKPAEILKGILQAVFIDEKNGIIEILTTNYFFNVIDGELSEIKERGV